MQKVGNLSNYKYEGLSHTQIHIIDMYHVITFLDLQSLRYATTYPNHGIIKIANQGQTFFENLKRICDKTITVNYYYC